MKTKLLSIILAIIMLISGISVYASAENKTYSLGDVNGDGNITASDARTVLRVSAKLENNTEVITTYGDLDFNGRLTASDARKILRISARLDKIPCGNNNHDYETFTVSPTCSSNGYTTNKCKVCDMTDGTKTNIVKATGCNYEEVESVALTCTTDGYKLVTCKTCGTSKYEYYTKATGHDFTLWEHQGDFIIRICKLCEVKESREYFYIPYEFEVYSFDPEAVAGINSELSTDLSPEARDILITYTLNRRSYLEGRDATKTKVVVYNISGGWGVDKTGASYNPDGTPKGAHDKCGKILGYADDMCDGYCAYNWSF